MYSTSCLSYTCAFELLEVVLQIVIDQLKVAEKDPIVGKWNAVVCCGCVFVGISKRGNSITSLQNKHWWFAKLLPIAIYSD